MPNMWTLLGDSIFNRGYSVRGAAVSQCRRYAIACYKHATVNRKGAAKPSLKKQMISAELKDILEHSQLAALYHYNDLTVREWDSLRLKLGAKGFKLKIFPSKVSAKVLKGTKYENMAPLFSGPSVLAFSDSSPVLSDLLTVTKGEKKLLLLGGLMENQLFSSKGLEDYTKLPSLEVMHQELVGVLSHPQTMLSGLLQGSAARLSCMLDQISKADQTHP